MKSSYWFHDGRLPGSAAGETWNWEWQAGINPDTPKCDLNVKNTLNSELHFRDYATGNGEEWVSFLLSTTWNKRYTLLLDFWKALLGLSTSSNAVWASVRVSEQNSWGGLWCQCAFKVILKKDAQMLFALLIFIHYKFTMICDITTD